MKPSKRGLTARLTLSWTAALLFAALHAPASAQTVADPRIVEFYASADHSVVLASGQPAVSRYLLEVYLQGASAPFTTTDMGKPAPQADGIIRYDFSGQMAGWPLPGGVYEARVAATGPNGTSRSSASNPFTLSSGTTCTFSVSPTSVSLTSGGGSWVISVSTGTGCAWTASSSVSWIAVSTAGGSGSGTTTITAGANTGTTSRTATVTVAGIAVTVTQAPTACTYSVSPTGLTPGSSGGAFTVNVDNASGCSWKASSGVSWISVSPASGSGTGTVTLTVAANTATTSRTGTVTVAGQAVTVTQSGAAVCTYAVSPTTVAAAATAQAYSISVTAGPGCTWTATSDSAWVTFSAPGGSGNATISATLTANTGTTTRTATLTVAGQQVVVSQAAQPTPSGAGAGDGLKGEYFDNANFTAPVVTRVDPGVNFNWGNGAPAAGMGANTFSVRWTGRVQAQFSETYTFYTVSDDGVRLWVNGQLLIDRWSNQKMAERSATVALAAGQAYELKLEYFENTGRAAVRLLWSSPSTPKAVIPKGALFSTTTATSSSTSAVSASRLATAADTLAASAGGQGLRGDYFDNADFTAPTFSRVDLAPDFDWGPRAPAAGMGADRFSVRWTGRVQAQVSELYTFYTVSDDGVRLWVNGELLVDNWTTHEETENSGSVTLIAGDWYDIRLEYFENSGSALVRLLWSSPSTPKAVMPPAALSPNGGTPVSAATASGGTTSGLTATAGIGDGLRAEYYDGWDFTAPAGTRVDPVVDFEWGTGAPLPGMGTDTFSVRWSGRIEAQTSEVYTFYTVSDDGVRLWVGDQLVIDNWTNHASTENRGSIALVAGQAYPIRLEYFQNAGEATARLLWSSASTPKAVVPTTRLFSTP